MHRHDMIRLEPELSTAFIFQVMKALQIVYQSRTIPSFSAYKGLLQVYNGGIFIQVNHRGK